MKYKSERKRLDDECMLLLKNIVRLRDKGCVTPGLSCGGYLTASHWKKRVKQYTRYDLRNVNCQCANCNQRHNHYTEYYDDYMLTHYGLEIVKDLTQKAMVPAWKWSIPELRSIRDALRIYFNQLEDKEEDET